MINSQLSDLGTRWTVPTVIPVSSIILIILDNTMLICYECLMMSSICSLALKEALFCCLNWSNMLNIKYSLVGDCHPSLICHSYHSWLNLTIQRYYASWLNLSCTCLKENIVKFCIWFYSQITIPPVVMRAPQNAKSRQLLHYSDLPLVLVHASNRIRWWP